MIAAFRSELLLLNRFRMWAFTSLITIAFTASATALLMTTAQPAALAGGPIRAGGSSGIPLERFSGPGGATAAVSWAIYGYGFLLLLVAFTSRIGTEFTKGTFRAALLHHPNRWSLIGGKMMALMAVTATLVIVGLTTGAATSALVAPTQNIDTTGWFGVEALQNTAIDFAQTLGWAFAWAMIGTTLAVFVRSIPVAICAGVLWFGPIENVIGDQQDLALRWFPGLLIQQVNSLSPDSGSVVSTTAAMATLAVYGLAMVTVVAVYFKRLDVTS